MDYLRNAKRYHSTVSFIANTGFKEATDIGVFNVSAHRPLELIVGPLVHKYNQLMKDLPLDELLSATDVDKIQESLSLIFGHIDRKLHVAPYPIRRALPLAEAVSRDFNEQLTRVLTSRRLLYTPYDTFERLLTQVMNIFRTWDGPMKGFTDVARELTRKRSEKFIPIKVVPAHDKLQERTMYLKEWRKRHEQLAVMTGPTKGLGVGMNVGGIEMEEVKEAYKAMKRIDVLDQMYPSAYPFPTRHCVTSSGRFC
jgi:hypothetical protein